MFRTKAHGGKKKPQRGTNNKKVTSASSSHGLNPFDVRNNAKTKYEVLGKKVKGQARNVAIARAQAESKRRKTLASQFQARNKVNAFKDKRLGEQDPTMSLEDKMMARFQTERKRKLRNAQLFALNDNDEHDDDDDDDGDELFLTHKGKKIDDYDQLNQDDAAFGDDFDGDDDHSRAMDKEIVDKLHFGGGADAKDGGDVKKSHKEIMQEVMMKSKMYKAERQRNKIAQEDATEGLDKDFNEIMGLLEFRPKKGQPGFEETKAPMDDFDKMTRELAFEAKAKASERRMSPEEQAQRERDRLNELEKQRIARMNGDEDESEDDGSNKKKKKKKKASQLIMMPPTDDDLTTDYQVDGEFATTAEEEDEEEEEEDNEDLEEEEEEEDEEQEEEEEEEVEEEEEEDDDDDDEEDKQARLERKRKRQQEAAAELPFVFPCPSTPEDLTALFKQHAKQSSERRSQIVERLLKYYSPKLSVENQQKMKVLFAILLRQFLKFANQYAVYKCDLDALARHLFTLAQDMPETAGIVCRELLINLFKRLHSTKKQTSKWPQLSELLLFRAWSQIFSVSDLRHNVVSPLETLIGESLVHGDLLTPLDATCALLTCALSLELTKAKQRFVPEVLVCLKRLLRLYLIKDSWVRRDLEESITSLPKLSLDQASSASSAAILGSTLVIIQSAMQQYAHLPSFDELFHPIYLLLHEITRECFDNKQDDVNQSIAALHTGLETCWQQRRPLQLQTFAPSVLPTFMPKFDANYTVRKDKTLDRDQAKTKQLQRQVKRARKGAARELRRDAEFLAREKQREEHERLGAKQAQQKEIWKWLEEQNATFNQQVKKGGHMLKGGGSGAAKTKRMRVNRS